MGRAFAIALAVGIAVTVGAAAAGAGPVEGPVYKGRAVADVLRELQASRNLRIVFSSERVPPTLIVGAEPRPGEPRAIARQILEAHGLGLDEGPGGTLIVVVRPRPRAPAPAAEPATETPRASDPVRITEHVDVTERPRDGVVRAPALEATEIRDMAGTLDNVLQGLQALPGVAATNDEEGKLAVRGAGPEHNMVLLDGVAVHHPQRFGEFATTLFNPATAARVSIDPSGLEARFGGRLSSVVSFETRDGTAERPLAASGSLGLTSGDVLLEGRMPGTTTGSWWATTRGTYYRTVAKRFRDGVMPGFVDAQAKVSLHPTARTRLTLFGLVGRETLNNLEGPDDDEPDGPTRVSRRTRNDNRIGSGTFRWTPTSRLSSTTTLSMYSRVARTVDNDLGFFLPGGAFERDVDVRDAAARHQVRYALGGGRLVDAGAEVHRVSSSWRMQGMVQPDTWRGLGPTTFGEQVAYPDGPLRSELARTQGGGWLQLRLDAGRFFTLEPGVRADWNSYTGETAWQPRLRASWTAGATAMWAGLSTQAQTPGHESLEGLHYLQFPADGAGHGLRNERMAQVVVGAERALTGGFGLRVEAYRRRFDRMLVQRLESDAERASRLAPYVFPPDLPPDAVVLERRPTVAPESTGHGQATGLEVLLRRDTGRVTGWIGYTLARSTRDLYGVRMPTDFDRTHALNVVASAPLVGRLRGSLAFQASSGFPITPVQAEVWFAPYPGADGVDVWRTYRRPDGVLDTQLNPFMRRLSSINRDRLSGYSRLDLRLTYALRKRWEFYADVLNVLKHDNHVQQLVGHDEVGRPIYFGVEHAYQGFDRFLSGGLRVRF